MLKTYADIESHARTAATIASDRSALESLKIRILEDTQLFLRCLEECAAQMPENRVGTVEQAYSTYEQIRSQPLEWFADYWDYDQRQPAQYWNGKTITSGMLGAGFLLKMHGHIGA